MAKMKGLGRGLDALLGGDTPPPASDDQLAELKTEVSKQVAQLDADRKKARDDAMASARFDFPAGVAVDSPGNVYVADTENCTGPRR